MKIKRFENILHLSHSFISKSLQTNVSGMLATLELILRINVEM